MIRPVLVAVLGLLVAACQTSHPPARGEPQGGAAASPAEPAPDFARLRTEFGDRQDFAALCEHATPLRELFELASEGEWEGLLEITEPWLEQCPVDIDAQLLTAVALEKLGRLPESAQHELWYRGLVQSILDSGDGRIAATAFVVISIPEEYAVLRALGLHVQQQALVEGGIDALTVTSADGATTVVYFDPAAHFRRLERSLGGER